MKKLFLIPLMACMTCMAFGAEKFYFGVANESNQEVAMRVSDGMNLQISVPDPSSMSEAGLSLNFCVNDVPSLGMGGQNRCKNVPLNLNLTGNVDMSSRLSNIYGFDGAKMVVSVKAAGGTQSFLYSFGAYSAGKIQANPNAENEAKAAWELLADYIKTMSMESDADAISVWPGSYIQYNRQRITFEHDFVFNADFWTEARLQALNEATEYEDGLGPEAVDQIFLKKESGIQLGHTLAYLNEDVTIALTGAAASFDLNSLRNTTPADNIKAFASFLNTLMGSIDAAQACQLTVNIGGALDPEDAVKPADEQQVEIRGGLTPNRYSTICLPYGVKSFSGAKFYEIDYQHDNTLEMVEVTSLVAGKPYILSAEVASIMGVADGTTADAADHYNGLYGVFESTTVPQNADNSLYGFSNNILKRLANPAYVAANRAYINKKEVPTAANHAPNRVRKVVAIQEVATGMEETSIEKNGAQKVMVNGQLLIIRDGVKYNAQGVVVAE